MTTMIDRFSADVTVTDWIILAVYAFVIVGTLVTAVQAWRRKLSDTPEDSGTASIPAADIDAALAKSTDRVSAVRALRELHPELGLTAANHLIKDRTTPT
ncbi:hypothetical protein [Rhodococcus marinonascens]|uniref:hypothetical protein n=1 Tax=Rhodococcus marinonascens TaxID=38311 RepID=UPI0009FC0381|nr:hypothetical protein [Rhodococcus marinonascens]